MVVNGVVRMKTLVIVMKKALMIMMVKMLTIKMVAEMIMMKWDTNSSRNVGLCCNPL